MSVDNCEIIKFQKLVDSTVNSGIITLNEDYKNLKEKRIKIMLNLQNENGEIEDVNFLCNYSNLVNINYKLKSLLNQVYQSINNLSK